MHGAWHVDSASRCGAAGPVPDEIRLHSSLCAWPGFCCWPCAAEIQVQQACDLFVLNFCCINCKVITSQPRSAYLYTSCGDLHTSRLLPVRACRQTCRRKTRKKETLKKQKNVSPAAPTRNPNTFVRNPSINFIHLRSSLFSCGR